MSEHVIESEVTPSRILSVEQSEALFQDVLSAIEIEPWRDAANANRPAVEELIRNAIDLINRFEQATYQKHPDVHTDTDVIYIDSGPGPYSYKMLEPGKTDLDDVNYHKWAWSRKMDRARIRAAYTLAGMITAKRIEAKTGTKKDTKDLTTDDFRQYGPYLMYASVSWQQDHIDHVHKLAKEAGIFKIPDDKLVTYREFTNRNGEQKPIVNTEDQMEGLRFPLIDGKSPGRIVMVSHPAHFLRMMHILGKYPDSIPDSSILQLFPIPTPIDAVEEYAKAEIMGTMAAIFRKERASLTPYTNYVV